MVESFSRQCVCVTQKQENCLFCFFNQNEIKRKTDVRMTGLFLDDLLHLSVILASCFSKFGRSFFHQQFPLCRLIVFLAEYSSQLLVHFHFIFRDVCPNVLQSVDWIRLQC